MDMTDATEWEGVLLGRKVRRSMGDAQMVRSSSAVYCDNSHGCVQAETKVALSWDAHHAELRHECSVVVACPWDGTKIERTGFCRLG